MRKQGSITSMASARRANALGKAARAQIVDAAQKILRDKGWQAFSMRKVADACGVSVGNLTYHFPNKAKLAEAVMEAVCARYAEKRTAAPKKAHEASEVWLRDTITWLIRDAVSEETGALFVELWVMARRHDFGRDIVERFYVSAAGWIAEALCARFPDADAKSADIAAYYLLTLSEGSTVLFSHPAKRLASENDIIELAYETVRNMLAPSSCSGQ